MGNAHTSADDIFTISSRSSITPSRRPWRVRQVHGRREEHDDVRDFISGDPERGQPAAEEATTSSASSPVNAEDR